MTISIHEVAKRAKVSVPTVSNVINKRSQRFSPKTEQRVLEAMRDLGYQPNRSAQLLRGVATHTIGVLSHGISGYSGLNIADMIACLDQTLRVHDYRTLIGFLWNADDRIREHLQEMVAHRVEGVIITGLPHQSDNDAIINEILPDNLPLLVADSRHSPRYDSLELDLGAAFSQLAEHLLDLGHRDIAFVCTNRAYTTNNKIEGITKAFRARSLRFDDARILEGADGLEHSCSLVPQVMALDPQPTAVICSNDYIAIGIMRGLRQIGLDVPGDVSVTGCDGIWAAQLAEVPLTTLRNPRETMGIRAAELILDHIKNPQRPTQRETFPHELVIRDSTGPAKQP